MLVNFFMRVLFIDLSRSHLPFTSLQLAKGTLYSACLFYNLAIFYDSCSYLSSLLFLIPKTEFVSSFAFVLCSPFPTEQFQTALLIKKYEALFSRLFLGPSERNQNIQDNPEYNSVLPFRIILKIFAVNMLCLFRSACFFFKLLIYFVISRLIKRFS